MSEDDDIQGMIRLSKLVEGSVSAGDAVLTEGAEDGEELDYLTVEVFARWADKVRIAMNRRRMLASFEREKERNLGSEQDK